MNYLIGASVSILLVQIAFLIVVCKHRECFGRRGKIAIVVLHGVAVAGCGAAYYVYKDVRILFLLSQISVDAPTLVGLLLHRRNG